MMRKIKHVYSRILLLLLLSCTAAQAQQADTINTLTAADKLQTDFLKSHKSTYAVYMTGADGKRMGAAHLWDREIKIVPGKGKEPQFDFSWQWYMKDTLLASATGSGIVSSMKPLSYRANYFKRGKTSYVFHANVVTVPVLDQHNHRDSTFSVTLNPPAFAFPMDLELYGLLPFKKPGQTFVMAFYEPGKNASAYYHVSVKAKENLVLPGGAVADCWVLKVDYGVQGSFAYFWISAQTREVLKVEEDFPGGKSYKVKLY